MDNKDPWVIAGTVDKVPTPEAGDNYLCASILLARGSKSARGKVKSQKQDLDGSVTGKADSNPIKDTRTYKVEFPDGEIVELTSNAVA
jgi:hypothetical protein